MAELPKSFQSSAEPSSDLEGDSLIPSLLELIEGSSVMSTDVGFGHEEMVVGATKPTVVDEREVIHEQFSMIVKSQLAETQATIARLTADLQEAKLAKETVEQQSLNAKQQHESEIRKKCAKLEDHVSSLEKNRIKERVKYEAEIVRLTKELESREQQIKSYEMEHDEKLLKESETVEREKLECTTEIVESASGGDDNTAVASQSALKTQDTKNDVCDPCNANKECSGDSTGSASNFTNTVPFCSPIEVFTCDELGKTMAICDISVSVPAGAVQAEMTASIELGVTLCGPFAFPKGYEPVSPIIWLYIQEEIELLKPMEIMLPHMLISVDGIELALAKASHNNCIGAENDKKLYSFYHDDAKLQFSSIAEAIVTVKHCCWYCIVAKTDPAVAVKRGYCLHTLIESISPSMLRIVHVCTHFLNECFKALKELYPETSFKRCCPKRFNFDDIKRELIIKGSYTAEATVLFAAERGNEPIQAIDVDYWTKDPEEIELMHENGMFPPARPYTVQCSASTGVEINFEVIIEGRKPFSIKIVKEFNINNEACSNSVNVHKTRTLVRNSNINNLCLFLHLYAYKWRDIGIALGFHNGELESINRQFPDLQEKLTQLLFRWSQWPTSDHPIAPTVEALCDALHTGLVGLGAQATILYEKRDTLPFQSPPVQASLSNHSSPPQVALSEPSAQNLSSAPSGEANESNSPTTSTGDSDIDTHEVENWYCTLL